VDLVWDGGQRQQVEIQRAPDPDGPFETISSGERRIPVYSDFLGKPGQTRYYRLRPLEPEGSSWSPVERGVSRQSTTEQLLTEVQEASFRYFWDYGHPVSGLAREGSSRPPWLCTIGASGMGLFNLGVGVERGFVNREQAAERAFKILRFLAEKAHRYRGAYSHWLNGKTGEFVRFGKQNDGADLVETAFLAEGFLFLREYFDRPDPSEEAIRALADRLWRDIEWDHFAGKRGKRFVLNWHWYSKQDPERRMVVSGFNEAEIAYLLALGSPTHPVGPEYYRTGWQHRWYSRPREQFGIPIELSRGVGPPLFFLHYSYLGFDPRANELNDRTYFDHFRDICRIQVRYAESRSADFKGYGPLWGLTASMDPDRYSTHHPGTKKDNGTITPTAALSSMPYLPDEAISCLKVMYEQYGAQIWDEFGFRDAFNPTRDWVARGILGIDIGPIAPMIENYRTGLCWRVFMKAPEIRVALAKLGMKTDTRKPSGRPADAPG